MMLEAVWFKNGEEVFRISPVMNIVCDDSMNDVSDIEINDRHCWYSSEEYCLDADDFVIRIKKD